MSVRPCASSAARTAPTWPSIIPLSPRMSAPASARTAAIRSYTRGSRRCRRRRRASSTPQWPCEVNSSRHRSAMTGSVVARLLLRPAHGAARARWCRCSAASPWASRSSGTPKTMSPPTPAAAASVDGRAEGRRIVLHDAGHRPRSGPASAALLDEQRQDQAARVDGRLAHESAEGRGAAQPAGALSDARSVAHARTRRSSASSMARAAVTASAIDAGRESRATRATCIPSRRAASAVVGPPATMRVDVGIGPASRATARAADGERSTTASKAPAASDAAALRHVCDGRRLVDDPADDVPPARLQRERQELVADRAAREHRGGGSVRAQDLEQCRSRCATRSGTSTSRTPSVAQRRLPTWARPRRSAHHGAPPRSRPCSSAVRPEQRRERPDPRGGGEHQPGVGTGDRRQQLGRSRAGRGVGAGGHPDERLGRHLESAREQLPAVVVRRAVGTHEQHPHDATPQWRLTRSCRAAAAVRPSSWASPDAVAARQRVADRAEHDAPRPVRAADVGEQVQPAGPHGGDGTHRGAVGRDRSRPARRVPRRRRAGSPGPRASAAAAAWRRPRHGTRWPARPGPARARGR